MKTDQELKLKLAEMLPHKLRVSTNKIWGSDGSIDEVHIKWRSDDFTSPDYVKETEWLHVCWLIEQKLTDHQLDNYYGGLFETASNHRCVSASWQQRAEALIQIKNEN